jgi:hypothetical protein
VSCILRLSSVLYLCSFVLYARPVVRRSYQQHMSGKASTFVVPVLCPGVFELVHCTLVPVICAICPEGLCVCVQNKHVLINCVVI